MYAFCFLKRNEDENKKEIPCGAVFQSSRNSFRRILGQSQFFSSGHLAAKLWGNAEGPRVVLAFKLLYKNPLRYLEGILVRE